MKIKRILALMLSAVLLLSLAACAQAPATNETPGTTETTAAPTDGSSGTEDDTTAAGKNAITVKVVHKDGSEKVFHFETDKEFLGELLLAEKVIEGKEDIYGLVVTHADGEKAVYEEDKAYWALYEGDQYALQGISTTPITDGGEYALVYTKG